MTDEAICSLSSFCQGGESRRAIVLRRLTTAEGTSSPPQPGCGQRIASQQRVQIVLATPLFGNLIAVVTSAYPSANPRGLVDFLHGQDPSGFYQPHNRASRGGFLLQYKTLVHFQVRGVSPVPEQRRS